MARVRLAGNILALELFAGLEAGGAIGRLLSRRGPRGAAEAAPRPTAEAANKGNGGNSGRGAISYGSLITYAVGGGGLVAAAVCIYQMHVNQGQFEQEFEKELTQSGKNGPSIATRTRLASVWCRRRRPLRRGARPRGRAAGHRLGDSTMDALEPTAPLVAGGVALVVALFVAREIASGALNAAGRDLWEWFRRRSAR